MLGQPSGTRQGIFGQGYFYQTPRSGCLFQRTARLGLANEAGEASTVSASSGQQDFPQPLVTVSRVHVPWKRGSEAVRGEGALELRPIRRANASGEEYSEGECNCVQWV